VFPTCIDCTLYIYIYALRTRYKFLTKLITCFLLLSFPEEKNKNVLRFRDTRICSITRCLPLHTDRVIISVSRPGQQLVRPRRDAAVVEGRCRASRDRTRTIRIRCDAKRDNSPPSRVENETFTVESPELYVASSFSPGRANRPTFNRNSVETLFDNSRRTRVWQSHYVFDYIVLFTNYEPITF